MGLTMETLRDHLGIDYEDPSTSRILSRLLSLADRYMIGALGEGYPAEDERVIQAQLMICDDLYSSRGMSDKVSGATRRLLDNLLLQVRLEMRVGDAL
jgi:hypothetical protein